MTVARGPRPTSTWDSMTTPADLGLGVRLQLEDVRLQENHVQEVVDPGSLDGRNRHGDRLPAPVLRGDAALLHLAP